jgi:hypothetical protein
MAVGGQRFWAADSVAAENNAGYLRNVYALLITFVAFTSMLGWTPTVTRRHKGKRDEFSENIAVDFCLDAWNSGSGAGAQPHCHPEWQWRLGHCTHKPERLP